MRIFYSLFFFGQARRSKEGELVENQEAPRITCGGEINGDAIITSPGFDDPDRGFYYNDLNCIWDIDIPGASSLTIFPEIFEVETSGEASYGICDYDWLSINWLNEQARNHTYKFCSTDLPMYYRVQNLLKRWGDKDADDWESYTTTQATTTRGPATTTGYYVSTDSYYYSEQKELAPAKPRQDYLGNDELYVGDFSAPLRIEGGKATLSFMTDHMVPVRGFKLRIEAVTCNEVQTGSGAISSPNWPENYGTNEECKYTLTAEPGKHIKITFNEFHVENAFNCIFDTLTIMGRRHCGRFGQRFAPDNVLLIPAGSTVITWKTDGADERGGFSFSWESVDSDNEVSSGALESANGFHEHMQNFLNLLAYQMEVRRSKRLAGINRFWNNVQIAEELFQTQGACSENAPKYEHFDFKTFDSEKSMCTNLDNFAENARQFFDNFVCIDDHETPKRTLKKWNKMADKINRISAIIKNHESAPCATIWMRTLATNDDEWYGRINKF